MRTDMEKWLKCEISKGMFSDEVTVNVPDAEGGPVAVFVPKEKVKEAEGFVSVRAYPGSGRSVAILPDSSHTAVAVPSADLQPA